MIRNKETEMQTFRVDVRGLYVDEKMTDFLDMLAEFGSGWRVASYDASDWIMVLEFTSYEDAVSFAQTYFREDDSEDAKGYVKIVTT
jgi:hypothetical protein